MRHGDQLSRPRPHDLLLCVIIKDGSRYSVGIRPSPGRGEAILGSVVDRAQLAPDGSAASQAGSPAGRMPVSARSTLGGLTQFVITIQGLRDQPLACKLLIPKTRRDVRVVEGARLESVCRGNSTVGSNPTLSASLRSPAFVRELRLAGRELTPASGEGCPP